MYSPYAKEAEIARREGYIRAAGEEPPAESGGNLFWQALDVLDTPKQWLQGGAASVLGLGDYADKSFLDAAALGADRDITFDQLLGMGAKSDYANTPIIGDALNYLNQDEALPSLLRGVGTFAGEVLTDPLTYVGGLGLGGRLIGMAGAGYKSLNTAKLLTREGKALSAAKLLDDLAGSELLSRMRDIDARKAAGLLDDASYTTAKGKATKEAYEVAESPFRIAGSVLDGIKENDARGVSGLARQAVDAEFEKKMQLVRDKLNLSGTTQAADLFADPALRLRLPFGSDTYDIPLVTDATREAFKLLGGATYTAKVKVGDVIDQAVTKGLGLKPGSKLHAAAGLVGAGVGGIVGGAAGLGLPGLTMAMVGGGVMADAYGADMLRVGAKGLDAARKLPKAISRSAATGGNVYAEEAIKEHEVARHLVDADVAERVKILTEGIPEEELNLLPHIMESLGRGRKDASGMLASKPGQVEADLEQFNQAVNQATEYMATKYSPEMAERYRSLIRKVKNDYSVWRDEGLKEGFLGSAISYYVPAAYDVRPGMDATKLYDEATKLITARADRFDSPRKYFNAEDAIWHGLVPKQSFLDTYAARMKAQELAKADKRFMERMAYEFAMPKNLHDELVNLAFSAEEKEAEQAINALKAAGISLSPDQIKGFARRGIMANVPVMPRTDGLAPLSPDLYDMLYHKATVTNPDLPSVFKIADDDISAFQARKVAAEVELPELGRTGLAFTRPGATAQEVAEERAYIAKTYSEYEARLSRRLGRFGEQAIDRSGAAPLSPRFQTFIDRVISHKGEANLTEDEISYFRGVLPKAVRDSLEESLDTKHMFERMIESPKVSTEVKSALQSVTKGYLGLVRMLKMGTTIPFPAFHLRNLSSAGMQSAHYFSMGKALSIPRLLETMDIAQGKGSLRQAQTGRVFAGKELKRMAIEWGLATPLDHTLDLMHGIGTAMQAVGGTPPTGKMRKAFDKVWGEAKTFAQTLEQFGREHVFYNLIREGHSPANAASITKQLMVDYTTGKTKIERDVLTNIFFFYSFARGQSANTLHAMVANPGALTGQLHAISGAAAALKDPNAIPMPLDIDERIQSVRSMETGGRLLGRSKDGLPVVMSEVGVPMADMSRYVNIRTPKDLTPRNLMQAGKDSLARTAQTVFSQVNPLLRAGPELLFGKNAFFDRPLDDKTLRKFPKLEAHFRTILNYKPDSIPARVFDSLDKDLKKWLDGRDNGDGTFTINPTSAYIIGNLIPAAGRALATLRQGGNEKLETKQRLLRFVSGVKVQEQDFQKTRLYDRANELDDFAKTKGLPTSRKDLMDYLRFNEEEE